ncbi:MAG TPA: toll/interleukin-1 receptor domain-containing protein [Steroidobacteraceae bacterium]|nr:toll/interleukin-1 receptor domain-containing protein [Steroidobacteraceae bacterium]
MSGRDVFVSYSQPDRQCAVDLVAQLESDGLGVWIAPRDVTPAADWAAEIIDAICAARVMVLVFSSHCNDSPQVRREVERAVHRQVPLLPVRIEEVLPARSLEYFLSTQHWLDAFPPPRAPHYARLSAHIAALLRTPTSGYASGRAAAYVGGAGVPRGCSAPELDQLEKHLAYYVGPIAKLLLKRATARAGSREEVLQLLALEVHPPAARQQFIDRCHRMRG